MLVTTEFRSETDPGNTLDDYAAWRRLAIAVRRSVLAERPPGSVDWLDKWADTSSAVEHGYLAFQADPPKSLVSGLRWPKLPGDPLALALGGSKVFTDKIPGLVQYTTQGDAISQASDPEHAAARGRKIRATRDDIEDGGAPLFPWVKPAIIGAIIAGAGGALAWIWWQFRGDR